MNEIYVTGHRNPDTDSIVAAMSYAALKNALGEKEYVAEHLGTISDETNRMLERFHFKPPRCIQNVRTQVQDLDFDRPPCLDASVTMDRAWKLMREQKISAIPVANEDGTLFGMLSAGDVANYDMSSVRNPKVGEIPVYNLLSVIEGRILNEGNNTVDTVSGASTCTSTAISRLACRSARTSSSSAASIPSSCNSFQISMRSPHFTVLMP